MTLVLDHAAGSDFVAPVDATPPATGIIVAASEPAMGAAQPGLVTGPDPTRTGGRDDLAARPNRWTADRLTSTSRGEP
ncbi:hypothetical protein [Nocardia sp. NPDC057455]|uniref:hypothetical protein n=1 Tax=Nocardia sp. NPDC057455 TaxID=3346138 RepID=UPI0036718319